MENQIEGDGLIENFFKLIWEKQEKDRGLRGFYLPDSVIYKYQQPRAWYFTTKEGYIKRKRKESLNAKSIEQEFLKHPSKSNIVAYFIFKSENKRQIEYFTPSDLSHFLHHQRKILNGVLQKFVDPLGLKNSSIQMIWTPHLCLFEKRENLNNLLDPHLDIYEKVATFEGEDSQCTIKPFNGTEIRKFMHELGEALADHIAFVTAEKMRPSRMVLVFKQDFMGQLCLLFATSVRCKSKSFIDISTTSAFPENVNRKRNPSNAKSPLSIRKKVLCKNCELPCELDRICEVRISQVVTRGLPLPRVVKKSFPVMSEEEIEKNRNKFEFLNQYVLVCDLCYLKMVKKDFIRDEVNRGAKEGTPLRDEKLKRTRSKSSIRSESFSKFNLHTAKTKSSVSPTPQTKFVNKTESKANINAKQTSITSRPCFKSPFPSIPGLIFTRSSQGMKRKPCVFSSIGLPIVN